MVNTIESPLSLTCQKLDDLPQIAAQILEFSGENKVITFEGQLGSGKTALIKEISMLLGVQDNVTSPSFSIINEYCDRQGHPVYHFDFYRITSFMEAVDIGVGEYFYSGSVCLVEWPSKVMDLIPSQHTQVEIEVTGPESRIFHLKKNERKA